MLTKTRHTTPASHSSFASKRKNTPFFQPKLHVGTPGDKYEVEADSMADKVINKTNGKPESFIPPAVNHSVQTKPAGSFLIASKGEAILPLAQKQEEEENVMQMQPAEGEEKLLASPDDDGENKPREHEKKEGEEIRAKGGSREVPLGFESRLNHSKGSGSPLPDGVKNQMESGFGTDFSNVRIHTDSVAVQMNQEVGAQAFTYGNDIYFNSGKYDLTSGSGKHLLAHELTHTIQQGASIKTNRNTITETRPKVQRSILDHIGSFFSGIRDRVVHFIEHIPGFFLFTVLLGKNPLNDQHVDRNGRNILKGLLLLLPNGQEKYNKLVQEGAIQRSATWIDQQIAEVNAIYHQASNAFHTAVHSISLSDVAHPGAALERIRGYFNPVITRARNFAGRIARQVLQFLKDAILNSLVNFIRSKTRAYPLLRVVLGHDPVTHAKVPRTMENIIHAFLMLTASGEAYYTKMKESGALKRAINWMRAQLATLPTAAQVVGAFKAAWKSVTFEDLFHPLVAFKRIYNILSTPIGKIVHFVGAVARQILIFIKDAMLGWFRSHANHIPGYHLLTVILGKDIFTHQVVPRTTANIIRGFMGLIPGGEAQFQQMRQSKVITRLTAKINNAIKTLGITWSFIQNLFIGLWHSMHIGDLLHPFVAFHRIITRFRVPIRRLFAFVRVVITAVIEILLRMMNFPVDLIGRIVANAMQAYEDIKRDPIGFLKNLMHAAKKGFQQFFQHFVPHLISGVTGWLFSELSDAGIQPPPDISFKSILGMAMEVLGITADNIFARLARKIGQSRVNRIRSMANRLTGIWSFIKDVMNRGPVAIWERIQGQLHNLWNVIIDGIKNWIVTRIIQRVTARLLSMLDPTGIMAVVNGFMAFFNAVQSFIQQLTRILQVINTFIRGVGQIARGNIQQAANFLENALAGALPVAIAFLANQVGLSGLGHRVGDMIGRARQFINRGIDWLIDKALRLGRGVLNVARSGAQRVVAALIPWRSAEKRFTAANGEHHKIFVDAMGSRPVLKIASNPTTILEFLSYWENRPGISTRKRNHINQTRNYYNSNVLPLINRIETSKTNGEPESARAPLLRQLLNKNSVLSMHLRTIIGSSANLAAVRERYALEGTVGRYESMPHGTGDRIEADHQPQNSVLEYAAAQPCFATVGNLRRRAANRSARGFAINLHELRHRAGRTYGRSPASSFTSSVNSITNSNNPDQIKRAQIVEQLKTELRLDVDRMNSVANRPLSNPVWNDLKESSLGLSVSEQHTFQAEISRRILSGEGQIANQPMDNLKD